MSLPARFDIPQALLAFASKLKGGYDARYDSILDEAFLRHQMILTGHTLRMIAGGGSNPVAQAALERWRGRLHQMTAQRLDAGEQVPDEISERFGHALADLWAVCAQQAHSSASVRTQALEQGMESLRQQCDDEVSAVRAQAQVERDKHERDQEHLTQTLRRMADEHAALKAQMRSALSQIQTLGEEGEGLRRDLDLARQEAQAQARLHEQALHIAQNQEQSAQASLVALRSSHEVAQSAWLAEQAQGRAERDQMRREHLLALDAVRTQAKKDLQEAEHRNKAILSKQQSFEAEISELRRQRDESRMQVSQAEGVIAGLRTALECVRPPEAAGTKEH
jgi:hypothetical protein